MRAIAVNYTGVLMATGSYVAVLAQQDGDTPVDLFYRTAPRRTKASSPACASLPPRRG